MCNSWLRKNVKKKNFYPPPLFVVGSGMEKYQDPGKASRIRNTANKNGSNRDLHSVRTRLKVDPDPKNAMSSNLPNRLVSTN
jgi:hypothetical protein